MRRTDIFLTDEGLSTLASVLARYPNAEVVKYSPQKRCVVRVSRQGQTYYAKVYPPKFLKRGRGENINQIGKAFWSLSESGGLNFRVPSPAGWDAATRTIWNKELKGVAALEKLTSREGEKIAFSIGKAVALIEKSNITPNRVFEYSDQLTDTAEFADVITHRFPELVPAVDRLLTAFQQTDQPTRTLVPIHGDMHIDQWLADRNELGLLDFEDFSLGHPERDLAFFMVQLEAEYGHELDYPLINACFLQGYKSQGLWPSERLLNIYSAHKWFSKASKESNVFQATKLLDRAANCLKKNETLRILH